MLSRFSLFDAGVNVILKLMASESSFYPFCGEVVYASANASLRGIGNG